MNLYVWARLATERADCLRSPTHLIFRQASGREGYENKDKHARQA